MARFKLTGGSKHICLANLPRTYSKVQGVRPIKGQYQVSVTAIRELITGEINGNILKILSGKELI
jgi:hypothetical protein